MRGGLPVFRPQRHLPRPAGGAGQAPPAAAPAAAAPAPVAAPAAAPAPAPAAAPVSNAATMTADGLDWDGLYEAVMPPGTYTRPTAAPAAAAPVAAAPAAVAAPAPVAAAPAPASAAAPAAPSSAAAAVKREAAEKREERPHAAPAKEESIRVDAVKLDALLEVAGESVQAANQAAVLLERLLQFKFEGQAQTLMATLAETLERASRYSTELQRATLATRMQPVGRLFQKFPRLVRELAKDLGKDVELTIEGAETEVDRVVVDSLYDPLVHMLRNALDHGVETPEERAMAGKSIKSFISLKAWQEANSVMIVLQDDGKGMDPIKLRAKALQKGLISESAQLTNDDCFQLVFLPGFSTKEVASSVSGRGVGMDVVKRNITAMGGVVDIRSAKGFGTTISISLPLTLAILDGMSIRVGEEVYILPLGFVVESLQPVPDDVKEISGKGRVIKVRGEYLPLVPLYQMFDITPRYTDPCQGIVVIIETEGRKACLFIDELVGQQQVVVKNLESNYRKVTGISGATILGDGGVALILDVTALIRSSRQLADEQIYS
ncbi:MAG: chemotaxis protein CheA [Burkholderiaceae bacterium]|nr:chemotaxis protein CheA [Burkholderiaceae bacterium]